MRTRAIREQFESLQRESELVLDHLRRALPVLEATALVYDRPRLKVVPAGSAVHRTSDSQKPGTSAQRHGRI